jgi:ABC-type multidrug transport system ATPase subunit
VTLDVASTGTKSTASLHRVSKGFGQRTILEDLTFAFEPATRFVVRGPSGCGKSTLLNLLAGYLQPDAGRVTPAQSTGYVLQDEMLFSTLTVRQNLLVRASALGLGPDTAMPLVLDCLRRTNVAPLADATVAHLSGGERQRVQLAGLLLASVDLLLLDEPTSKLDSSNRRGIADVVSEVFRDRTVIVVTHDDDSPFAEDAVLLELRDGTLAHV